MRQPSLFSWSSILLLAVLATPAWAQPLLEHPSGVDSQQLYRRLQAAEQRIHELEMLRLPPVTSVSNDFGLQPDVLERLESLEKSFQKQADAAAKAKADAARKPTQKWSGRVHADYWSFPQTDDGANFFERGDPTLSPLDRVQFRRLRFGVSGDILETMTYKVEMEFADPNDTTFKDAYLGWTELPCLHTVLLGNQKRPYGLDHLNSSRYNVFLERPFVIEAFNQDARRFGLCSYGLSDDEAYNWRFGTFFQEDIAGSGAYLVPDDPGTHHYQMEVAGRFANTVWYDETSDGRGYAHWAVSGTVAFPDGTAGDDNSARFRTRPEARTSNRWIDTGEIANADTYEMVGLEGVVNVGALQWVGEIQHAWVQRDLGLPEAHFYGGYIYVAYFLTGEHTPWERDSGTLGRVQPFENFFLVSRCQGGRGWGLGAWQVAARYSFADFSDEGIQGGVGESFTFGLNWWWTPYSRLQLNYINGEIHERGLAFTQGNYNIIGARFMVDF